MADYSVTAANVQQSANAVVRQGTAGETITAGQAVYKDSTDSNKIKLADCTDANKYQCTGVALNGASDGQPIDYVESDDSFNPGFTVAIGDIVVLSVTGGSAPSADLTTGDYAVILGVANSTSTVAISVGSKNRANATIA